MKGLYISLFCPDYIIEEIRSNSSINPGYAGQKFDYLMIKGLQANGVNCEALSSIPINRHVSKRVFWFKRTVYNRGIKFHLIPFINIPVIHQICLFIYSFFYVFGWGIKDKSNKFIIADVLNFSICSGSLIAAKLLGLKCVGVMTDMPGLLVNAAGNKASFHFSSAFRCLLNFFKDSIYHYDAYVFLTQQMNEVINKRNVPYIVMEGLVDSNLINENCHIKKSSPRTIVYAGGLHERYGLKMLVEGFMCLKDESLRLDIYGSGPFVEKLETYYTKIDSRIKYMGVVANDEILKAETLATLLVNPRPTHEEFTKYSFPSKNMEYVASGTPLLTTNLPGMPSEYLEHVFIFEKENVEGYTEAIQHVLSLSPEELMIKGSNAKSWILMNKNNIIQTKRILELIETLEN